MPWIHTLDPHENIGWRNVMMTQLSIARFSGGITYNGKHYVYNPQADELVRGDILKRAMKWKREQEKAEKAAAKELQQALPIDAARNTLESTNG